MKVSIDTRTLQPGDIFIPIKGKNFDGHDFIEAAKKKGAAKIMDGDLAELARNYRKKFNIPVVAVTGSVGKTTTKDMTAAVLGREFTVLKNEMNLNNEIGLPLTVLKIEKETEAAVLEMGMRSMGEIKFLAEIAAPAIGIITNIGLAHIELLKTRQNIARAKSELIDVLAKKFRPVAGLKKPVIILNGDEDFYKTLSQKARLLGVTVRSFGRYGQPEFTAKKITSGASGVKFLLFTPSGKIEISLKQPGEHNVYNALAAAAAAETLGLTLAQIKSGLEKFTPSARRMEIINTPKIRILNDTYNASPDSMRSAIKILKEQNDFAGPAGRNRPRKIAVLGDMLELGNFSRAAHRSVGETLAENGINILAAVGPEAFYIGQGALNAGLPEKNIYLFKTNAEAIKELKRLVRPGDVVLAKGSRGMKMEEIVAAMKGW